jgi:hypothetical protein
MYYIQSRNPVTDRTLQLPQRYDTTDTAEADLATLQTLFPHLEYIVCTA